MKNRTKRFAAALMAAVMCLAILGACSSTGGGSNSPDNVGTFTTQDINGQSVTQDIFKDYDLTLVNIFATWCSPCVSEMPDLEKLHQQMADKNVNVVGILLDAMDEDGNLDQNAISEAQQLVKDTGVTYPVLIPDAGYMNGRLSNIEAFPETFFVDKDGNIVGETYSGSSDLEGWLEVVEKELADLNGDK